MKKIGKENDDRGPYRVETDEGSEGLIKDDYTLTIQYVF